MAGLRMKFSALMQAGWTAPRIERLAAAVRAWRRGGSQQRLDTGLANDDGDPVARLAADIEQMSERLAGQASALARAERQQRELLSKVSHDLRTPLASMQGYLELLLLRQGSLDAAEERNYLQTAVRQSERLARLVDHLLELARLEAEGMQPQSEDFALAELANDIVQKFSLQAQQRAVHLCTAGCRDGHDTLRVRADLGLVERVLHNLVENALRHTPAAGTVTIELARDANCARVLVRDTGEGIAQERLAGIFDRYVDSQRIGDGGPQGHGGLGLAIAQRIVRLHGSKLEVRSTRGQGTQVRFDLPLADAAVDRHRSPLKRLHP